MAVAIPVCTPLRVPRVESAGLSATGGTWIDRDGSGVANGNLFTETSPVLTTDSLLGGVNSHYGLSGAELLWSDYTFTGVIEVEDPATDGIGVTFLSRANDDNQVFYLLSSVPDGGAVQTFKLSGVGFTPVFVGTLDTGTEPATGESLQFVIRATDESTQNRIQLKIWGSGSAEPAGWQVDVTDSAVTRPTTGGVGIWSSN